MRFYSSSEFMRIIFKQIEAFVSIRIYTKTEARRL